MTHAGGTFHQVKGLSAAPLAHRLGHVPILQRGLAQPSERRPPGELIELKLEADRAEERSLGLLERRPLRCDVVVEALGEHAVVPRDEQKVDEPGHVRRPYPER